MPKKPNTELSPPEQRRLLRQQERELHEHQQRKTFVERQRREQTQLGPWFNRMDDPTRLR